MKKLEIVMLLVSCAATAVACGKRPEPASLVLKNGDVYTMEADRP
ncbi:MAG: hypothetical protein ACE148_09725 [Vicinamibacterales bacterium]